MASAAVHYVSALEDSQGPVLHGNGCSVAASLAKASKRFVKRKNLLHVDANVQQTMRRIPEEATVECEIPQISFRRIDARDLSN